jgi:hypothetical protein
MNFLLLNVEPFNVYFAIKSIDLGFKTTGHKFEKNLQLTDFMVKAFQKLKNIKTK